MRTIKVGLKERSYSIVIAESFKQLPAWLNRLRLSREGCIISHASILKRSGNELMSCLKQAGWQLNALTIPESETAKSFDQVKKLLSDIAKRFPMRVPTIFALGGGVVGDVAGFVASVYRRGVPYVQLPTTLLAQVDSSVGGKVGVDTPEAKNLLGAFYQPKLVWNHTGLLKTLPLRQRRSGLAEIIKYGVMADPELFRFLETHLQEAIALEAAATRFMIEHSCAIKARVVSKDERETKNIRVQLNFGHTLGHALEAATGYTRLTHGEAIAIGMCVATEMAVNLKLCDQAVFNRLAGLFRAAGLPTCAQGVSIKKVRAALRFDKKFIRKKARWVLPVQIGKVVVTERVPAALLDSMLKKYVKAS